MDKLVDGSGSRQQADGIPFIPVQKSRYWKNWNASKSYNLTANIYGATFDIDTAVSQIKLNQLETYIVVYLNRDRMNPKKKTSNKRLGNPVWEECVAFTGLDLMELICIEVRMTKWGISSDYPVVAGLNFSINELLQLNIRDNVRHTFPLISVSNGISGNIEIEFTLDPPILGNYLKAACNTTTNVLLNTSEAYSCLLFTSDI